MPSLIRKSLPLLLVGLVFAPAVASAQRPTGVAVPIEQPPGQPTTRNLRVYEAPVGAPPQGVGFDPSVTWGVIAKLVWKRAPNARSYVVNRKLSTDWTCCNASSGPITDTSWTDTGLLRYGAYVYTLRVNYADGSVGKAELAIGSDGVKNPVLTARDLSPGWVRLTFDNNVKGTSGFLIGGPGMGNEGKTVISGPVDIPILKPGTYTWTIASVYKGLGILSPHTEWSRVTHTVTIRSGRYRISLERFKAINVTHDDMLQRDGKGDEVYITTQINEYKRDGSVSSRMVRTPTFGDVNSFPARVRAGSASSLGGIVAGDEYPAPVDLVANLKPATTNDLPFLVWEGDLTELDGAVVLSPAIWESDLDDRLVPVFQNFHIGAAPSLRYRGTFGPYLPSSFGDRRMLDTWSPKRNCEKSPSPTAPPTLFEPPFGWGDQPIDIGQDNSYCPIYVAINYEVARSLTTVNRAMVMEIPIQSPANNWKYMLYVRVEKVN